MSRTPPANSPTAVRRVQAREREARALELRREGQTFPQIGAALGVTAEGARKSVTRALAATVREIGEQADALRALESEKLDAAARALWPAVAEGDVRAQDTWLRNRARFAALLGLDLKPEINVSTGPEILVINTTPPWEREARTVNGEAVEVPQIGAGE
jgi:hypothetical protein